MLWLFGPEACRTLAPPLEIKTAFPKLEGEVLNAGPPGESQLLIATLKENYDVVASNRQELYQQLNPKDAATIYDDPIATVTEEEEDDGENFEFDENTFLENIDE